jgi:hypothetical protein
MRFMGRSPAAAEPVISMRPDWSRSSPAASRQPPTLDIAKLSASQLRIGVNGMTGQTIILQSSADLAAWQPLATNTLAGSRLIYTNTPPSSPAQRFYRAVLSP